MFSACVSSLGLSPTLRASGRSIGLNGVTARCSQAGSALRPAALRLRRLDRHAVFARPGGLKPGIVDVDFGRGMAQRGEVS